jgi:N-acetylneuraminic acid mutarotase
MTRRTAPAPGRSIGGAILLIDVMALMLVLLVGASAFMWLDSTHLAALTPGPTGPIGDVSAAPSGDPSPGSSVLVTPPPSMVVGNGTWTAVDPLPKALWGPTSVTLPDGRFMVIGGSTGASSLNALSTVYVFDPASGKWSRATGLLQPRAYAVSAVLGDGSVLVAGGSHNGQPIDTAERYFPSSGVWIAAGRLNLPRTHATLTLLRDGRAFIAGGGIEGGPTYYSSASTEIYNPKTNDWTIAAPMAVARALHTATMLSDGEVLIAGGADIWHGDVGHVTTSVQIYNPVNGKWRDAAPLAHSLYIHGATGLKDGRVLVAGGWWLTENSDPSHAEAQIYDPARNAWTPTGSLNTARAYDMLVTLPDGRVVAIGGVDPKYKTLATCELYDPDTGAWTFTGPLPWAAFGGAYGLLPDGRVMLAGGSLDMASRHLSAASAIYVAPSR